MTLRLTEKELKKFGINIPKENKSKYKSKFIIVDGIKFSSQKEANFYCDLKILLRTGEITGFCRQARFVITEGQNGNSGTEYVTDFVVFYPNGTYRIVDVKGMKTDVFKLKMKSFAEKYPKLTVDLE